MLHNVSIFSKEDGNSADGRVGDQGLVDRLGGSLLPMRGIVRRTNADAESSGWD